MTEPSKTSQPVSHPMGADQAKAYVPPQVLKAKPKVQVGGAKVEIKAGADPRRAKTVVGSAVSPVAHMRAPGTAPAMPLPPEVAPYMMAMTPPGGAPAAMPVGAPAADAALPFKPAAVAAQRPASASQPPAHQAPAHQAPQHQHAAPVNGHAPANGATMPTGPKNPPLRLVSLGELLPLPSPVGGAAAAHAGDVAPAAAPAAQAPAVQAPAAQAASVPQAAAVAPVVVPAAPDLSVTPPPVVVDTSADAGAMDAAAADDAASPWGGAAPPAAPPAEEDAADAESSNRASEPPVGSGNSPWLSAHSVDVDALPSSAMLSPTPSDRPPATPAVEVEPPKTSSMGMTIGLALAALALIGIVAYFVLSKGGSTTGPADVKMGTEQKDYKDTPLPSAKPTVTAAPKPKPVYKPPPKPVVAPRKPARPRPPVDIYEDF